MLRSSVRNSFGFFGISAALFVFSAAGGAGGAGEARARSADALYEFNIKLGPSLSGARHIPTGLSDGRAEQPLNTRVDLESGRFLTVALARAIGWGFRVETELGIDSTDPQSVSLNADAADAFAMSAIQDARSVAERTLRNPNRAPRFATRLASPSETIRREAEEEIQDIANNVISVSTNDLSFTAEGKFLTVSHFTNLYYDLPLPFEVKPYLGGGLGLTWTKFQDGFTRAVISGRISHAANPRILGANALVLPFPFDVRRFSFHNSREEVSFATNLQAGLRWHTREGPTIDAGYQWLWIEEGYRQTGSAGLHLFRFGMSFSF